LAEAESVTVAGVKGRRWRDFRYAPNLGAVSDGRAANGGVTAGVNWMKKENLTSLPPAGQWFWPARSLRKIAAGGHGFFPARGNFPQSPANIGASVRADRRGGWQRKHSAVPVRAHRAGESKKPKILPRRMRW